MSTLLATQTGFRTVDGLLILLVIAAFAAALFMGRGRIATIARREVNYLFQSPIAYAVIALFLLGCGVWLFVKVDFFDNNRAELRPLFETVPLFLAVLLPAVTMRMLSEEKRSGTIELLVTMPVTDTQIVLGKFVGALFFLAILLGCTLIFPALVSDMGTLDRGQVIASYIGLFLVGAAYLAIGLMTSTWTKDQILALVASVTLCLLFYGANQLLALAWDGAQDGLAFLSVKTHFENIARGVVDTRDLLFYATLIGVPLVVAVQSLQARNWK